MKIKWITWRNNRAGASEKWHFGVFEAMGYIVQHCVVRSFEVWGGDRCRSRTIKKTYSYRMCIQNFLT